MTSQRVEPEQSERRVLVVGATGMLGRPVALRLRADGYRVRVLVRDPDRAQAALGADYEYAEGNVGDVAAVRAALEGCSAVHVSLKSGPGRGEPERVERQGTARVAETAADAGIERIGYLSGCYVSREYAADSEAEAAKLGAELAIERSGVPFTIFKPTYFMETLALHMQGPLGVVLGRQPHRLHMVAADDYAAMVSRAFVTPQAAGKRLFVFGPGAISIPDALRVYCSAVHGHKRVVTMPLAAMAAVNGLFMGGAVTRELALMRIMQRVGEPTGVPDAGELLGPATTTLAQWCARRAEAEHASANSTSARPGA